MDFQYSFKYSKVQPIFLYWYIGCFECGSQASPYWNLSEKISILQILLYGILFCVIRSFSCDLTEDLFNSRPARKFVNIERVARRKLLQLHAAISLLDLRIPPSNMLELLSGSRKGQHSICINGQWCVCFLWKEDGAHNVEIVDYHWEYDEDEIARWNSPWRNIARRLYEANGDYCPSASGRYWCIT